MTRRMFVLLSLCLACSWIVGGALAQQSSPPQTEFDRMFSLKFKSTDRRGEPMPLAYRQEYRSAWDTGPGYTEFKGERHFPQSQLGQEHIKNPELELRMYGAWKPHDLSVFADVPPWNRPGILFSQQFEEQVPHVWTGMCAPNCGLTFRDREHYVDLSGNAKIRWLAMVAGTAHEIRIILKLADGTWMMAANETAGYSSDYVVSEFTLRDILWKHVDVNFPVPEFVPEEEIYQRMIVEAQDGAWFVNPDLSRVDEIGWADLTPGSGHGQGRSAPSAIAWMEVYGSLVPRASAGN